MPDCSFIDYEQSGVASTTEPEYVKKTQESEVHTHIHTSLLGPKGMWDED